MSNEHTTKCLELRVLICRLFFVGTDRVTDHGGLSYSVAANKRNVNDERMKTLLASSVRTDSEYEGGADALSGRVGDARVHAGIRRSYAVDEQS